MPEPVPAPVAPVLDPAPAVPPAAALTLVYAPSLTVVVNHPAPVVVDAAARCLAAVPDEPVPAPAGPVYRRTLAERSLRAGMALTGAGAVAVAASIAAGDPSFLFGIAPAAGAALILGSAAAINRQER